MPKSRKLEQCLLRLDQIRDQPGSELGLATLQSVLQGQQGVAIAQAAHLVGQAELRSLIPDLVKAFDWCLVRPQDHDPGCLAKQAIAEALYRLNYSNETLFLQGIRHVQWEPVWGGQVDTAPRLRGTCALGLVRMNYPPVMVELADLLADPDVEARIGAARAIAYSGNDQGVALLRLRIKIGDTLPVLSECLRALLQLAPVDSLPLVQEWLYARTGKKREEDVARAEAAALALAEANLPDTFARLRQWWQQVQHPELRQSGLLAIATLRQPEVQEWLFSLIQEGELQDAQDAIKSLTIHRQNPVVWQRVEQTVAERGNHLLQRWFANV